MKPEPVHHEEKVVVDIPPSDPARPAAPAVVGAVKRPVRPMAKTLIGQAPPAPPVPAVPEPAPTQPSAASAPPPPIAPISPIVPQRRTPAAGMPAVTPSAPPRPTPSTPPSAGRSVPPPVPKSIPPRVEFPKVTPAAGMPPPPPETPKPAPVKSGSADIPPIVRIPGAGAIGSTSRAGSMLCEILLRNGSVTQEKVDEAIALQEERGGQIGRILVSIGACSEEAIARALIEQLRVRKQTGEPEDISAAARVNKEVAGLQVLTRPGRTVGVLLATDIVALLLAAFLASGVHWLRTYAELGAIDWSSWLVVGPSVALCMLTFLGLELYSPMAKSTPDEIRDVVFSCSLVHLGASLLSTLGNLPIVKWGVFVRGVWWLGTLFFVPVFRALVRNKLATQPWWGIPVCVLGAAKTGRLIVRTLKAQPRSGLKPVMLLDDDPTKHGTLRASFTNEQMDVYSINVSSAHWMTSDQRKALADDLFGGPSGSNPPPAAPDSDEDVKGPISSDLIPVPGSWRPKPPQDSTSGQADVIGPDSAQRSSQRPSMDASVYPRGKFAEVDGVPIVGDLSLAPVLAQRLQIPYAVVAMPGVDSHKLLQIVERIGGKFSHLLIIPDLFGFATMGVPAKSLGGVLGVEVRQQLLLPGPRLAKRVTDVALTCMGGIFVLPFLVLIGLLIKLDSKGPIFYTQNRLGRDGTYFKAYKFRTMHGDGEARLKAILDADPALRAEYEIYHKLRKDPRVTRIGRVLRKFSLDEFPQLLNVILGDMSLVGPRPYIERELTEMGGQEKIILRAPPGMTGMWQVSDRNATSFAQRCQIDVYYVRNWSPWLDIHILAKTFGVVIKGSGV